MIPDLDGLYAVTKNGQLVGGFRMTGQCSDQWVIFLFNGNDGSFDDTEFVFLHQKDAMTAMEMLYSLGHKFENPNC